MSNTHQRPPRPTLWDQPPLPESETIEGRFERFHEEHPGVYAELVRLARQLQARGFVRYSIKGLFEIVRWNAALGKGPSEDFKLNNNFSAHYARLIMEQEADLCDFFRTREQRAA